MPGTGGDGGDRTTPGGDGAPAGDGNRDGDGGSDGSDGESPGGSDRGPSEAAADGGPGGGGAVPNGDGDDGSVPSAVLTSVADVGTTAGQGTVLYTADAQPVVSLLGDLPAWRTLEVGVGDGEDVRQLEENLAALGYGEGVSVDETFSPGTAAAVEAWETDLGRRAPDRVVTLGDVVFLSAAGDVLGHEVSVGDLLDPGDPVLSIGAEQRVVLAKIDATDAGGWTAGSVVDLEWADGATSQGTVFGTGRDATDGQVDLLLAVDAVASGGRRSGAEATITLVGARRDGALAVPVAALVDDDGATAVRLAGETGVDEVVRVDTGLVADGWVEITAGLDEGDDVRLPG